MQLTSPLQGGLSELRYLADRFVDKPREFFSEHQTVYVKVRAIEPLSGKISFSMREADTNRMKCLPYLKVILAPCTSCITPMLMLSSEP